MCNCKDCEHSVFDENFGEYKCKVYERTIYILLDKDECKQYKKKTKKDD